jgi:hypothetical protein
VCRSQVDEDDSATDVTCETDHEVRYFCGNSNVVDFHSNKASAQFTLFAETATGRDIDTAATFVEQPALYNINGAKYAECVTSYINENGREVSINGKAQINREV